MRVAVFSDIHCHIDALDRALDAVDGAVDEVLVAGDIVYEYRFSNDVVGKLREIGARCILGNHDLVLLSAAGKAARAAPGIDPDHLEFLAALPTRLELEADGRRLLMVHGSPWEPYGDYLHPTSAVFDRSDELGVDVLVLGHTHVPMATRFGTTLVVNPGSISEPRQEGRLPTYAVIDMATGEGRIEEMMRP